MSRVTLVRAWTQPLRITLLGEESFHKVDPLFQLAHPLFQLIELGKAGLNVFQRPAPRGRVVYRGLQRGPLTRLQALRPNRKKQSERSVNGAVPRLTVTRGEPNAPEVNEGQHPRNWYPGSMPEPHIRPSPFSADSEFRHEMPLRTAAELRRL